MRALPVAGWAWWPYGPHTKSCSCFEWLYFCFEAFDSQRQNAAVHFDCVTIAYRQRINVGLFQVENLRWNMNEDLFPARNEKWKTTRWHKQTPATTRFTLKTKLHLQFNNKTPFMHQCKRGGSLSKITLSCRNFSMQVKGGIVNVWLRLFSYPGKVERCSNDDSSKKTLILPHKSKWVNKLLCLQLKSICHFQDLSADTPLTHAFEFLIKFSIKQIDIEIVRSVKLKPITRRPEL